MKIVIVGVGALGSHVLQFMRNVTAEITIVDFDKVESKNTQSQFHGTPAVGKSKVLALSQAMQYFWGSKIKTVPHKLVSANFHQLLSADLIIDCVDNGDARRLIKAYAEERKIPCLHGALAADGSFGRAVWLERFLIDDVLPAQTAATCENGEHLPFIAITAGFIARAAQRFCSDGKKFCYEVGVAEVFRHEVK